MDEGVIVMVAVIVELVTFVAVKEGISPVPPAPRPIAVLLFVQEKVVPGIGPLSETGEEKAPLHKILFETASAAGEGLTVMV